MLLFPLASNGKRTMKFSSHLKEIQNKKCLREREQVCQGNWRPEKQNYILHFKRNQCFTKAKWDEQCVIPSLVELDCVWVIEL